jgi:nicotinamide-nucleotide amidase
VNQKTVIILCVSREILEGAVVDRNAAFMAARVTDLGFRVRSMQVLDRVESEMIGSLKWALDDKPAYILVTGGIGPGVDDNTRACLAKAASLPLVENRPALAQIAAAYRRLHAAEVIEDGEMNQDRARMAMVPEGSITYENPIGTAPAVQLAIGPTTVFLLPGVPAEMQRLFLLHVLPALSKQGPQTIRRSRNIDFPSRDESSLGRVLSDKRHQPAAPRHPRPDPRPGHQPGHRDPHHPAGRTQRPGGTRRSARARRARPARAVGTRGRAGDPRVERRRRVSCGTARRGLPAPCGAAARR